MFIFFLQASSQQLEWKQPTVEVRRVPREDFIPPSPLPHSTRVYVFIIMQGMCPPFKSIFKTQLHVPTSPSFATLRGI